MLHESCNGCGKAVDAICSMYAEPITQWKYGRRCAGRTHNLTPTTKEPIKQLNPLKASKRRVKQ